MFMNISGFSLVYGLASALDTFATVSPSPLIRCLDRSQSLSVPIAAILWRKAIPARGCGIAALLVYMYR